MITITKTITQPIEVIEAFADNLGYQSMVANPESVATPNSETGALEYNDVPRSIANPQTKLEYVSEKFDAMAALWFSQFAEKTARRTAEETVKATVAATESAIRATITTII